ncbi:MAG: hypothetical protein KGS09_16030 [Nitrospirae bacterium]|nr:hypothetical protein [Nitrospirota bacterium]
MSRSLFQSVAVFLFLILASALDWVDGSRAAAGSRTDDAPVVFVAHDYGFAGPDRIPAGVTTMQVVNKGQDLHHIQLLRLLQGKTADDFRAALTADSARLPNWIKFVGGPNAVLPGSESAATMNLAEGEYLLICIIPNKDGVPHMALGMQKPLSVRGAKPMLVAEPKAGLTITLTDFRFAQSQPITAGSHTIQVMNQGAQPHEVVVLKLDPGASAKDFGAAFEPGASGPPPGKPVGGVVGLESGEHAFFTARFEPGRYGLICFFPDPVTGKPHFAQGMTSEFTVK